jgi:hypothetical protein
VAGCERKAAAAPETNRTTKVIVAIDLTGAALAAPAC